MSVVIAPQDLESEALVAELVTIAMRASHVRPADTWRYFCGCCWRRIRENAEMAAQILKAEEGPHG